jgi:hypothetical protein
MFIHGGTAVMFGDLGIRMTTFYTFYARPAGTDLLYGLAISIINDNHARDIPSSFVTRIFTNNCFCFSPAFFWSHDLLRCSTLQVVSSSGRLGARKKYVREARR